MDVYPTTASVAGASDHDEAGVNADTEAGDKADSEKQEIMVM